MEIDSNPFDHTLLSRFGKTNPQGSLTGSASGEGMMYVHAINMYIVWSYMHDPMQLARHCMLRFSKFLLDLERK